MNRIKNYSVLETAIVKWMKNYLAKTGLKGWVIGVSGGLDSAVASTLAAKTGAPLMVLEMPIKQAKKQMNRGENHINWLKENFDNVQSCEIDLDFETINYSKLNVFDLLINKLNSSLDIVEDDEIASLAEANSRSRLRMLMLYYYANLTKSLVVGTGNKVEDFGIFFFSKGGDGTVDISPIADIMKSEVRELGKHMGVLDEIITAIPTDGLWEDNRSDEDAIGATYDELEWAMEYIEETEKKSVSNNLTPRQIQVIEIYRKRNSSGKHKVEPIPMFNTKLLRE